MKRFTQIVCMMLIFSLFLVNPVWAAEDSTRASAYFGSRLAYLHPTSGTQFQVWIEVVAVGMMDKLGACEIIVQRSPNNSTWTDMKTYTKESNPNLVASNDFTHEAYVTYTATSGYYYRAEVCFYAEKGNGTAESSYTTDSIYVS